jgi:hypothetical protein
MSKYYKVNREKYPKFFCNKCGARCEVSKALQDYDTDTGERNYKYWLRCPNHKFLSYGHQNEGAHLYNDAWRFSSGFY